MARIAWKTTRESPARVLIVSTMVTPDIVEHPDSEKVAAWIDEETGLTFRKGDAVPQFLGEVDEQT